MGPDQCVVHENGERRTGRRDGHKGTTLQSMGRQVPRDEPTNTSTPGLGNEPQTLRLVRNEKQLTVLDSTEAKCGNEEGLLLVKEEGSYVSHGSI